MKINKLTESKKLKEGITNTEPVVKFQGKSSHTFTKDKKWEVDFDEAGNILARTRKGKPFYFKGHINDKVNDFPSTDEDNIILAAREQHGLKFGNKNEAFEKDGGPFWYFTRHGLGPGMLPKGVNVVDTIEDDNFGTYIALDKVLSTQELKDYELKEKKPSERDSFRVDESKEDNDKLVDILEKSRYTSFVVDEGDYIKIQGTWRPNSRKCHNDYVGISSLLDKKLGNGNFDLVYEENTSRDGGNEFSCKLRLKVKQLKEGWYEDHLDAIQRKTSGYDKCYKIVKKARTSNPIDWDALDDARDHFGYDLYKMCLDDVLKEMDNLDESFNDFRTDDGSYYIVGDHHYFEPKGRPTMKSEISIKDYRRAYNNRKLNKDGTDNLDEAFKPSDSGIQSVKCYNRYNYTIQELRIDNDNKTFERGNFTAGKADKKTKNRQEFEDIVDSLKELGYTEIKSDYRSLRNKTRKGIPTNEATLPRNASKIRATHRYGDRQSMELSKDGTYWREATSNRAYPSDFLRRSFDIEVLETDPNYKPNRTKPEYVVQGNYGYGWEDLTSSDNPLEAKADLKAYRENELGVAHRLITRRVPVNESKSIKESIDSTFKVGDTFDYSGLYGGSQHCEVINVTDNAIECKVNWTSEDDGKDVSDTATFKLDTDSEGNQCAIVWEYNGEVGRVYPHSQLSESIDVNDIAHYIIDNYEFDNINDQSECIDELRDSFKFYHNVSVDEIKDCVRIYKGKEKVKESFRPYDNEKGQVMADKWYASQYPDDEVGIEQLKGITLDDALKDRSILDHCDTQVRERVYAQLDKYIPLSKESPMYKEKNESKESDESELITKYLNNGEFDKLEKVHNGTNIVWKLKEPINEASYGGAFDIADDQYFTREDLENAAEEVLNHINETFEEPYNLGGTWFEDGKWIVNVQDDGFNEYEVSVPVDMRKIREPWHLRRAYADDVAAKLIAQIKEYNGLDEDTTVSSTFEFDDDVDDLTYYYDDEEFRRELEEEPYNEIASKQVPDVDGFLTDYTMYQNMNTGEYVFVFGDKDVYRPEDGNFDWECETEEEAREWFDNYIGFDDDLIDECWSSKLEEETETSPIVHKKTDGSYLVQSDSGDGYTAFNKDNVCQGHISASNETEAKNKFNSNKFDE